MTKRFALLLAAIPGGWLACYILGMWTQSVGIGWF